MLSDIRLALSFLTILPVRTSGHSSAVDLLRSSSFFPFAGWVLGFLMALAAWFCLKVGFSPWINAVLLVGGAALLTRGLHLDGVADFFDGLGGAFEPEKRLAIMKDSSIGTYGVVGLVFVLLLKTSCLAQILTSSSSLKYLMIAAVPAAARWAMITLAFKSEYPRPAGTGHAFVGNVSLRHIMIGAAIVLPMLLSGFPGLALLVGVQAIALLFRMVAHAAFGGVTGDVLGAACEFCEAIGWLLVAAYLQGTA